MPEEDYTYSIEQLDPEFAKQLDELRSQFVIDKGYPPFRLRGMLFSDIDEAVERARALASEGITVYLHVRYMCSE